MTVSQDRRWHEFRIRSYALGSHIMTNLKFRDRSYHYGSGDKGTSTELDHNSRQRVKF